MAIDSKVAFQNRALEFGIEQANIDTLANEGIVSYATYAYCCTHRRPRNDWQLIRPILADGDVGLDELPEARVDTNGPVETALTKFQCLLANARAITGTCHLLVIKRFLELATARPRDPHLIHEVIDAERAGWQSVSEFMSEGSGPSMIRFQKWPTADKSSTPPWHYDRRCCSPNQVMIVAESACRHRRPHQRRR